jgi:hypothetical protein
MPSSNVTAIQSQSPSPSDSALPPKSEVANAAAKIKFPALVFRSSKTFC